MFVYELSVRGFKSHCSHLYWFTVTVTGLLEMLECITVELRRSITCDIGNDVSLNKTAVIIEKVSIPHAQPEPS